MNEEEAKLKPPFTDLRERCPTCNMLAPQHRKWCVTPVIRGETTMETREIEGAQSVPLKESVQ